jgi:4-hydroxybenzoate polyprenyltransferase
MLASLRVLVGALLTAPVFIVLAMAFVLAPTEGALDATPLLAVPLVVGAAAFAVCETVGYRTPALAPGTPRDQAQSQSAIAYRTGTTLRFALCEAVLFICVALGFVVTTGGYLLVVLGAVVAMALVWFECWPRERPVARTQASLERDGAASYLREALGLAPGWTSGGPGSAGPVVREL